jgi:glycosyltransferase involved in cell wall biosynthesis
MDAAGVTPPSRPQIIHVLGSVQHGGAERVVLDLVRAQHGVIGECRVLCLHELGSLQPEFEQIGVAVEVLPASARGALRTAWHLAGLLRSRRPRVVHAHNVAPQIAVALGRHLRGWGDSTTRLIYTEHGRLADDRPMILALRRWLGRQYDAIIGVSDNVRDQLLQLRIGRPERTHVIKNGVDLRRFVLASPLADAPARRIVSVGRLSEIKGPDVLLDAFALARERLGPVTLTLVGDGPMRPSLEAQRDRLGLRDLVEFSGAQQDVRPLLRGADLFVLPSRSEGVSLALLEAMAMGLPIVATAVGGTPEVTGPGRGGLVVPPEQPGALADAMVTMLNDRDLAAREGAAARRRVEEAFSLDLTVAAYAVHYRLAVHD